MKTKLVTFATLMTSLLVFATQIQAQEINDSGNLGTPELFAPIPIDNSALLPTGQTGLGNFFSRNNRDLNAELAMQQNVEPISKSDLILENGDYYAEEEAQTTSTPRVGIDLAQ